MSIPAEPVLIVDDDLASCRFMAEVLAGAGYRVEWTTDDDGALERVHRSPYALVIADVTMPGVSGTEIVADLGRVRPGAPALLVSAFADEAARAAARRLGVPLLAKPFAADRLLATVRALTTATAMSHEQDSVSGGWTGLPAHGGPASTIRKDAERG
ncbi:MAG: response regulator [Deltaproteobacteria bacterium]|nr:MAG: response regulator [Deltaproteobacteria bacterium]TMB45774.1 MAG: response regulator [Deltaproteobacteria bacterium]